MKFKLDENLGQRAAAVLVEAGFDVATVSDQRLEGAPDREVVERCVREERCLVTMDSEFGNPLRFPPHRYRGIILLPVPARLTSELILEAVRTCGTPSSVVIGLRGARLPCPVRTVTSGSSSRDECACTRANTLTPNDCRRCSRVTGMLTADEVISNTVMGGRAWPATVSLRRDSSAHA